MTSCEDAMEQIAPPIESEETTESLVTRSGVTRNGITRSSGNANTPDLIAQIYQAGIPLFIYFPAGLIRGDARYMTDHYSIPFLLEVNKDPSHPNRRWLLDRSSSTGLYSLKSMNLNNYLYIKNLNVADAEMGLTKSIQYLWEFRPTDLETGRYNIIGLPRPYSVSTGGNYVLHAQAYQNDGIRARVNNYNGYCNWIVSPDETFDVLEFSYDYLPGDSFTMRDIFLDSQTIGNSLNNPIQRTVTFANTVTNESTFSQTQEMSISKTVEANFKVGIPEIGEGQLNTSYTVASQWGWTEGRKETQSRVLTIADVVTVPPQTTVIAKHTCIQYTTNITYIAKLRGKASGKILYAKGRWIGAMCQENTIQYFYGDGTPVNPEVLNTRHLN